MYAAVNMSSFPAVIRLFLLMSTIIAAIIMHVVRGESTIGNVWNYKLYTTIS
jgi:hypothetical protein